MTLAAPSDLATKPALQTSWRRNVGSLFCEPCRCRLYPAVLLQNFVSHINEFGRKGICRVVCWGTRDEKMFVLRV
jgi:hypothetical protein